MSLSGVQQVAKALDTGIKCSHRYANQLQCGMRFGKLKLIRWKQEYHKPFFRIHFVSTNIPYFVWLNKHIPKSYYYYTSSPVPSYTCIFKTSCCFLVLLSIDLFNVSTSIKSAGGSFAGIYNKRYLSKVYLIYRWNRKDAWFYQTDNIHKQTTYI